MIPLIVKACWTLLHHVKAWLKSYFYNYHFNILQLQCPPVASKTSHSLQLLSCQASIKRPSKGGCWALNSHKGTSWRMSPQGVAPKWAILSHEKKTWDLLEQLLSTLENEHSLWKIIYWKMILSLWKVTFQGHEKVNFGGGSRTPTSSVESPFWNSMSQLAESVSTLRTYPGRQRPSHQTSTKASKSTSVLLKTKTTAKSWFKKKTVVNERTGPKI